MNRAILAIAFCGITLAAHAHLNHIQFASIEEVGGKLRIRYRMSADMFMSNLELDIKNGRLDASIKKLPISEIIAQYFQTHLQLEGPTAPIAAESVTFTPSPKNGDWIADFIFPEPGADAWIFCDAFLDNNLRTLTLAHIDWRGEKTVFHFRKDNERYKLGSSASASAALNEAAKPSREHFVVGLAAGLRSYAWIMLGALALCGSRLVLKNRENWFMLATAIVLALACTPSKGLDVAGQWGFGLGWIVVVLTAQKLLFDTINAIKRRPEHA